MIKEKKQTCEFVVTYSYTYLTDYIKDKYSEGKSLQEVYNDISDYEIINVDDFLCVFRDLGTEVVLNER